MKLDEAATRTKVIELLDGMSQVRLDLWVISGTTAGVLDPVLVENLLLEELPKRSQEVIDFWNGPCDLCVTGAHCAEDCVY